jgi:hypothetical protein
VFGLSAVTAAAALVLGMFLVRSPQPAPALLPQAASGAATVVSAPEQPRPIKEDQSESVVRAKPTDRPDAAPRIIRSPAAVPGPDSPDFLVSDPAGYAHSLDEYLGRTLVVGVWSRDQADVAGSFERLYRTFAANERLRFVGVSKDQATPANTTFPVFYNQGSKLLGVQPGEFVVLDEKGVAELRGSLVTDFVVLSRTRSQK